MAYVYITQEPSRFDRGSGMWVSTANLSPAKTHGALRVMFPPEASRSDPEVLLAAMKEAMRDYSENDCLLALGDPTIYAMAAAIAAQKTDGLLRLLKWDRLTSTYSLVEVQL